jgi:hypothetical protein
MMRVGRSLTVITGLRHSDASCFEVFVRNQREYVAAMRMELVLPRFAAAAIATAGAMALLMGAFLYLFPGEAIDIWQWPAADQTDRSNAGRPSMDR